MKLYTYENCEGDKGVIVANSWEEAVEIYKKEYPKRELMDEENDSFDYWNQNEDGECMMAYLEEVDYVENGKLYCTFSW